MFQDLLAEWSFRPVSQKIAVGLAACVTILALLAGGFYEARHEARPIPATITGANGQDHALSIQAPAAHQMFALVSRTYSDGPESSLLDQRLQGVIEDAIADNAQLTVYLADDEPEVHQRELGSARLQRPSDNPSAPLPSDQAQALIDQVEQTLQAIPPSPATSVPGSLRLLAQLFADARRSNATEITGWLVGDQISTVSGCQFFVADMSAAGTDATARNCLVGRPIDLGGAEVRLVGAGQDLSGQTDPTVSLGAVAVVSRMIKLSQGRPVVVSLDGGPTGIGRNP